MLLLPEQLPSLGERLGHPVFGALRHSNRAGLDAHVRLVARTIGRCRIGLALSSGSSKGLAHVGVIQVLEENGIDIVAGSSMGAYVGACWCAGHDGRGLQLLAEDIVGRRGLFRLVDPIFYPRRGFIRGRKVRRRIARSIENASFSDLVRPLRIVATDLGTLRTHVFDSGSVADAVHASVTMPGVCIPVEIDGELYTDGAVSDPLPVDVLEHLGIERIIAVDTVPTLDDLEACELMTGQERTPGIFARAMSALNRQINFFARGNVLDTLMRGLQSSQTRLIEAAARRADVHIHAFPCGVRWYHFDQHATYIAEGRNAALEKLDAIKRLQGKEAQG